MKIKERRSRSRSPNRKRKKMEQETGKEGPQNSRLPTSSPTEPVKTLYATKKLEHWKSIAHLQHEGMLVSRSCHFGIHQGWVDQIAAAEIFGKWEQFVASPVLNGPRKKLRVGMKKAVGELLEFAKEKSFPFPADLATQIEQDAVEIGITVGELLPKYPNLRVAVEIQGKNTCSRWHQDHYVGRAIVSYTGVIGTEYTSKENVDLWEFHNCGNNDHIIRDVKQIKHVNVGDVLFIKGKDFPLGVKALIHKAPEIRRHPDGGIMNRLVLKIDVSEELF